MRIIGKIILYGCLSIFGLFAFLIIVGNVFLSKGNQNLQTGSVNESPSLQAFHKYQCRMIPQEALAAVVVCLPGMSYDEYVDAGKTTCFGKAACNAWFWHNANLAPKSAPTLSNRMTPQQTTSAAAVWVNASQTLNYCNGGKGC